jgi:nucleoside-diphosphate-sugar epimerase
MAYGISKLAVEHLGRSYGERYGIECINLRTIWVYGPGLPRPRVPKILVEAAVQGRELHLASGGDFAVDHTHVADLVSAVLAALDKETHPFDAYNIGTGQAVSLFEMVELLKELVPGARLSIGAGNYEFAEHVPAVKKGALDISRARAALGWTPRYDLRAGLADYVAALRRGV